MNDQPATSPADLSAGRLSDMLSQLGLMPRKGEARQVLQLLESRGLFAPSPRDIAQALEDVRAGNSQAPSAPEQTAAIQQTAAAAGIAITALEAQALAHRLNGPAGAGEIATALRVLRRPVIEARLAGFVRASPDLPLRIADARAAAAGFDSADAADDDILLALITTAKFRLKAEGSPEAALATAINDLQPAPGKAEPGLTAFEAAAHLVGSAFGMPPRDIRAFAHRATEAERQRRREAREAARAAREARQDADRAQKAWEATLIGREDLQLLFGASSQDISAWIRDGRIPVARRMAVRQGGREYDRLEFDPAVVRPLLAHAIAWRAERADHQAPAIARRPGKDIAGKDVAGKDIAGTTTSRVRVANAVLARVAAMDRYAAHFKTARALIRRITIITGPTNSGKTHLALERLAAGQSGVALAPLRLLAHEYREALAGRGIQASLVTGEERDLVTGASFSCATVEMCPMGIPMDVAVIDEAQMLADPDRGHAWTAAIMGVPARDVLVLGSPDCIPMVRRIAELCGDEVEEVALERKSPLVAAREPVAMSDLRRGDALIAFSRRDVLNLKQELQRRNRRVACVYGALSPEVRRAEARRFREGETDILIATDAIGMGLNLGPLGRVIFSALEKWDGKASRRLTASEIKQIGGRAGRFGMGHDEGIVAVLAGAGRPEMIALALKAPPDLPTELRPRVGPDADIVAAVAAEIGTDSLYATLSRLRRAVLRPDDPNYILADIEPQIAIASAIDRLPLPLLDRWTYALCPVDTRDWGVARLARWAQDHAAGRKVFPPMAGSLGKPEPPDPDDQERAEKGYRRLVAWRWLSLRFPAVYADTAKAISESDRLNDWIERALAARPPRRRG